MENIYISTRRLFSVDTNPKLQEEIKNAFKDIDIERIGKPISDALRSQIGLIMAPGLVGTLVRQKMEAAIDKMHREIWSETATVGAEWPPIEHGQAADRWACFDTAKEEPTAPRSAAEFLERKRQRVTGKLAQQGRVKPWEAPAKRFR